MLRMGASFLLDETCVMSGCEYWCLIGCENPADLDLAFGDVVAKELHPG